MARDQIEYSELDEIAAPPRVRSVRSGEVSARRAVSMRDEALPSLEFDDDDEEPQFLRTEKRVAVRRSSIPKKTERQVKKGVLLLAALAVVAALGAGVYSYLTHSWRFRIASSDNIEVDGVQNASRSQVMEVAKKDILGKNIFSVPLDEKKEQLERIPWVESASVMRLLPNRVAVHIEERVPVAFVQLGSRVSLIDAGGYILGLPANRQAKYSFAVIHGISDTEPLTSRAATMRIYNRLEQELAATSADPTNYAQQLSEVDLFDPEDVKVTANDPGGAVVIHLGASNFLARYKLYVAHIAEWRQQFQNLRSVDLRYEGQIIVNPDAQSAAGVPAKGTPAAKAVATSKRHHRKKK